MEKLIGVREMNSFQMKDLNLCWCTPDPADTSVYPKSWPYCTHTFTADINTTHSKDAGNPILIVLHPLNWLKSVTCPCLQPIPCLIWNDIFIPSVSCWEAFCKNCVMEVETDPIGLQSMHMCVYECMFVCVMDLKWDRSQTPALICPTECLWWGANSLWLQPLVAGGEKYCTLF